MKKNIIIITGAKNSGKTTMAYTLCSKLDVDGKSIGGVIQVLLLPGEEKNTYTLSSQHDGTSMLMLDRAAHENWERAGNFFCNPEAAAWADQQFAASYTSDFMIFDEIGRFELEGKGFDSSFSAALQSYAGTIVAIIRDEYIEDVCSRYAIDVNSCIVIGSHDDKETAYVRIQQL